MRRMQKKAPQGGKEAEKGGETMQHGQSPDMGSLSEGAIKRQICADAVQHPATLLPMAVSVMAVIYLLVLSPVFGGGIWASVLMVVSGAVAAAAFIWRYVFRYTEEYARRVQELLELLDRDREHSEQAGVRRLHEALQTGFASIGSAEGLKALSELAGEHEQLQPALRRQDDMDPLAMSHIPGLAGEAYRRGLSVLSDALELMEVAATPMGERLEKEIAELEKEAEVSKGGENQAGWLRIREERLASHRQRLDMLGQLQLRIGQLLLQAERCEASLHRTRIEVAAIRTGRSETSVGSVIQVLQGTIAQVKEVQEELKRLGY